MRSVCCNGFVRVARPTTRVPSQITHYHRCTICGCACDVRPEPDEASALTDRALDALSRSSQDDPGGYR
jgi:hypothetical protein